MNKLLKLWKCIHRSEPAIPDVLGDDRDGIRIIFHSDVVPKYIRIDGQLIWVLSFFRVDLVENLIEIELAGDSCRRSLGKQGCGKTLSAAPGIYGACPTG